MEEACANCRFMVAIGRHDHFCRRLPPSHEPTKEGDIWPRVPLSGWCGEWEARPQPEEPPEQGEQERRVEEFLREE